MNYKHCSLLLIAGIAYVSSYCQPVIKVQRVAGGSADDDFTSMALTKDGGFIAGGYSKSNKSGEKSQNNRGGYPDYWIVKYDAIGNIEWDKTIGGDNLDVLQAVRQTTDGGYILGGYSYSEKSAEKSENSRGEADFWIVKLDSAGNIQWDKTMGGEGYDGLNDLQQTTDEGFILGGISYSNISGEKTANTRGDSDYWLVKLDKNGNIQWDKTLGGKSHEGLGTIKQTLDGGYIIGGFSVSNISGEKTQNSRGSDDYWIVKLNGSGSIEWEKTIGGKRDDAGLVNVVQTGDKGYMVGGWSYSNKSGEKTQNSRGRSDYWIIKLDSNGTIQWDKTIGGDMDDRFTCMEQTSDNGFIIGGYSYSSQSGEKTEPGNGFGAYWVVKLTNAGKIQWDKTVHGNDEDHLNSVKEIRKDSYLLGGLSYSGIAGDKTQRSRGGSDYWGVVVNYTYSNLIVNKPRATAYSSSIQSNKTFSVFPNPAPEKITVQTIGKALFTLTNQQGKIIITKTIATSGSIDVSHLQAGVYYLTNTTTGTTQKVIVSR